MSLLNTLLFVGQTSQSTPPSSSASVIEHSPSRSIPPSVVNLNRSFDRSLPVLVLALVTAGLGVATAFKSIKLKRELKELKSQLKNESSEPKGSDPSTNPYETLSLVHEYLMMHYHPLDKFIVHTDVPDAPKAAFDFPSECARECIRWMQSINQSAADGSKKRVLDIGCSVGRSSFELARYAGTVIGLDFSHAFIETANKLKETGELPYRFKIEGDVSEPGIARVDPSIDRTRCTFIQGDACALPPIEPVDCLLAANLVCRLPKPRAFLARLPSLIKKDGFVVLFSPHTWLEEYTLKSEWLGGYYDSNGNAIRTRESLIENLTANNAFRLVHEANTPFFIRETERKNQWTISHLTVFQRL